MPEIKRKRWHCRCIETTENVRHCRCIETTENVDIVVVLRRNCTKQNWPNPPKEFMWRRSLQLGNDPCTFTVILCAIGVHRHIRLEVGLGDRLQCYSTYSISSPQYKDNNQTVYRNKVSIFMNEPGLFIRYSTTTFCVWCLTWSSLKKEHSIANIRQGITFSYNKQRFTIFDCTQ
jgi:hypothetical protein